MKSSPDNALLRPFKPTDFQGRADRLEFGWNLGATLLIALFTFLALSSVVKNSFFLSALCAVISITALCAAYVRRLHDVNISGWWVIVFLILPPTLVAAPIVDVSYVRDWPNGEGMAPGDGTGIGAAFASAFAGMILLPFMALMALLFLILPSNSGPNKYGPNPNEVLP